MFELYFQMFGCCFDNLFSYQRLRALSMCSVYTCDAERVGACFWMSKLCHIIVLNSEHKNSEEKFRKKNFLRTYGHFLITFFYWNFENVQPFLLV